MCITAEGKFNSLTKSDAGLKGFNGGFASGGYGYVVPDGNSAGKFGKVVRFATLTPPPTAASGTSPPTAGATLVVIIHLDTNSSFRASPFPGPCLYPYPHTTNVCAYPLCHSQGSISSRRLRGRGAIGCTTSIAPLATKVLSYSTSRN